MHTNLLVILIILSGVVVIAPRNLSVVSQLNVSLVALYISSLAVMHRRGVTVFIIYLRYTGVPAP